jgi:nicotinamide-nucleotide amidase
MSTPSDADLREIATRVAACLGARNEQLVTAESCTGGWIAKACTDLPGSSRWFRGAAVTYANESKSGWLGVGQEVLQRQGAVSEATVRAMAEGALRILGGDCCVAVSGIAGPDGGSAEKPVGLVWFAWARRVDGGFSVRTVVAQEQFAGDRDAVRREAVRRALAGLLDLES